jgi:hypothetical protein
VEHVSPTIIEENKKQFNTHVCKSKLMDHEQVMKVLKHMDSLSYIESLREFLSAFFNEQEQKIETQDETQVEIKEMETQDEIEETKNDVDLQNFNFNLDSENYVLRTKYGNIDFAYDLNKEPVFRAIDLHKY